MCTSPKYCALHHLLTGAGDQVELDDLLSPLKKMKSFRSLQKRLVSPSVNLTISMTMTDVKYTHIRMTHGRRV